MENLDKAQRVALLKRLKEHLELQRKKFQDYLRVLDQEKHSIEEGRIEDLEQQITLEENIVREIVSVQKVILPMEEVYKAAHGEDEELKRIQEHLDQLAKTAAERNKANRLMLSSRINEIRLQMASLKPRPGARYYQNEVHTRARVDITT